MAQTQIVTLGSLNVTIESDTDSAVYCFEGNIDEHFDYRRVPVLTVQNITFHLRGVMSFNSCGTREWIYFLRQFPRSSRLTIKECSVVMYDQYNIVPQLFEHASIESFYAPYFCPKCDEEVTCLIETSRHLSSLIHNQAPSFTHHCKTELEFDALEECYFTNFK